MTDKQNTDCEACHEDAERLSELQAVKKLSEIPGWVILERKGILQLFKTYKFSNFLIAIEFANRVGLLAEKHQHHPELQIEWGSTSVYWWSHKIRGLHHLDFELAKATDLCLDSKVEISY
ncbi:MAG: 4a-hydroxytetrahydrobiopterin dehydratase [Pseudomonadota bacterium]